MTARRLSLPKSAADYAAIAVAPLLIFLMISSLANFLMLISYRGRFPERVSWTLLMFTLGAVGIARIAIERDRAYSLAYGGILGLVTYVAMLRFVDSPIFSLFILAIVAYLSDVIVRDCTLIEDDVDASGQGLIDSGRLFVKKQIQSPSNSEDQEDEPATAKKRKTHQPGRTVMYLSLAALPLFGLGQFMLRNASADWARARWLLAFYLFSSLSLLVTTSFLGLRRYLRQRDVEMPSDVSVGWLTGGLGVIALVLMLAYIAPLPGRAIANFEPPAWLDSPGGTSASSMGWGNEGADESNESDRSSAQTDPESEDQQSQGQRAQQGAPPGDVGDGNRDDGPSGNQSGGDQGSSSDSQSSQQQSSQQQSSQDNPSQSNQSSNQNGQQRGDQQQTTNESSAPNESQNSNSSNQDSQQASGQSGQESQSGNDSQSNNASQSDASEGSESSDGTREGEGGDSESGEDGTPDSSESQSSDQKSRDGTGSLNQNQSPSSSNSPSQSSSSDLVGSISSFFKWIVFLILAGVVGTFIWLHRELLAAWWQQWFGGQEQEATPVQSFEELIESSPPRPFASFRNPVGTESDQRRVVVVTFQAFEAWTREHGTERTKDETPAEFMRRVAKAEPSMSTPASQVVDAYNRIVYGRGRATERDIQAAKSVWKVMRG